MADEYIKKESPNEGTETSSVGKLINRNTIAIKKESPNEGTETGSEFVVTALDGAIKKESPNEGTETDYFSTALIRYFK